MIPVARLLLFSCLANVAVLAAQDDSRPPVIDMHLHGPVFGDTVQAIDTWLTELDRLNVRKAVLAAFPDNLAAWVPQAPDRLLPALTFPCLPRSFLGRPCFDDQADFPNLDWLRGEISAGRIQILAEIISQLFGISPADPRLEPYFALADELDIPVGLHMGPGPIAVGASRSILAQFPEFRTAAGNPLELDQVLRKYPNLRLFIMHAGWPMLDEMIAILHHHPNVYVEVGNLQFIITREAYYFYLRRLVEAGYGDRIMFGSDGGLGNLEEGIQAILEAEFLTEAQKRDILYHNAARFLRLPDEDGE